MMAKSRGYGGGSGGARTGTPGKSYSNRTDLNTAKPLAATASPGQAYGMAGSQLAAQKAVPMAPGPPMAPPAPSPAPPGPGPQPGPPMAGPPPTPGPGELPALMRPSERPNEPVTHGAASGPGAGPEAMIGAAQPSGIAQTIARIAQLSGNSDLMTLAQHAQAQGQ